MKKKNAFENIIVVSIIKNIKIAMPMNSRLSPTLFK